MKVIQCVPERLPDVPVAAPVRAVGSAFIARFTPAVVFLGEVLLAAGAALSGRWLVPGTR